MTARQMTVPLLSFLAEYAGEQLPAAIEDLTWQAEQEGITLADAIDKYGWQVPFAELVQEVRLAYPKSFAGARILSEERTSWIAFKEGAPATALDVVAKFPRGVEVIEDRGFSEAELDAQLREVDRKSTRLNSSHTDISRMPSSA